MPTYEITAPNGKTYRIEGPAGATDAQIRQQVLRQHPDASQRAKPKTRQRGTGIGAVDTTLDTLNELVIGGVQGIENMGAVITDPLIGLIYGDKGKQSIRRKRAERYEDASNALSSRPMPVARTAGQIATSLPFGALKAPAVLGRAAPLATRAVQGAIGGAAVRDSTSDAAPSMALGAAANVVLPPILSRVASSRAGQAVGGVVRNALAGPANAVAGKLDDVADAARTVAARATGGSYVAPAKAPLITPRVAAPVVDDGIAPLGRKAAARAARFERVGVSAPTTGMVTRDPRAWYVEREGLKNLGAGDEMLQSIKGVEDDLAQSARGMVGKQGGALGDETVGLRVQDALKTKTDEMQAEIGALYKGVRDSVGDTRVPSMDNLKAAQSHPDWADNNDFDLMVAAVKKRLARYADADGGAAGLNVKQAEELRKFIAGLGPNSPQTFSMRRILQDGLDADVLDNLGGAPFATARAAAKARFDEFKGTFAGKIADEGIAPERLGPRIRSAGTSLDDIRALKRSLTTGTGKQIAQGEAALQSLRGQELGAVFTGPNAITPDGKVNGTLIWREFQKAAPRLRILLDPSDYKEARNLAMAARDATADVPNSGVNYSNSASALANMFPAIVEKHGGGGILKTMAKHGTAYMAGGPLGNVALMVGEGALKQRAQQATASKVAAQLGLAKDPKLAAAALRQAQDETLSKAARAAALKRWQDLTGNNPAVGGVAAAFLKE